MPIISNEIIPKPFGSVPLEIDPQRRHGEKMKSVMRELLVYHYSYHKVLYELEYVLCHGCSEYIHRNHNFHEEVTMTDGTISWLCNEYCELMFFWNQRHDSRRPSK